MLSGIARREGRDFDGRSLLPIPRRAAGEGDSHVISLGASRHTVPVPTILPPASSKKAN
jgi:hypothetical protein